MVLFLDDNDLATADIAPPITPSSCSDEASSPLWQQPASDDKIVCGTCSADFPLSDTLLFIKHKRETCGGSSTSHTSTAPLDGPESNGECHCLLLIA